MSKHQRALELSNAERSNWMSYICGDHKELVHVTCKLLMDVVTSGHGGWVAYLDWGRMNHVEIV